MLGYRYSLQYSLDLDTLYEKYNLVAPYHYSTYPYVPSRLLEADNFGTPTDTQAPHSDSEPAFDNAFLRQLK